MSKKIIFDEDETPFQVPDQVRSFIITHYTPAANFESADIYIDTTELFNKLRSHFGDVITIDALHALMIALEFNEINMPGGGVRPVWLIKEK